MNSKQLTVRIADEKSKLNQLISSGAAQDVIDQQKVILEKYRRELRRRADDIDYNTPISSGTVVMGAEKSFSSVAHKTLDNLESFQVQSDREREEIMLLVTDITKAEHHFDYAIDTGGIKQKVTNLKRLGTDIDKSLQKEDVELEKVNAKIEKEISVIDDVSKDILTKLIDAEERLLRSSNPEDAACLEKIMFVKNKVMRILERNNKWHR